MRQLLVRPLGLITQPNDQGQYPPGALSQAHNVMIRDQGILEAQHGRATYSTQSLHTTAYDVRRVFDLEREDGGAGDPSLLSFAEDPDNGNPLLRSIAWHHSKNASYNVAMTLVGPPAVDTDDGKLRLARSGALRYLTTGQGVLVNGAGYGSGFDYLYWAGLQPPRLLSFVSEDTSGVAVPATSNRAYRAIFVREANGRKIQSAPSYTVLYQNANGTATNVTWTVGWTPGFRMLAGDTIELYATRPQANGTSPGSDFRLAVTYTITSSDVSANEATLIDLTSEDALGLPLYTNSAEEGELKAKYVPGLASDLSMHDGHAFYIMDSESASIRLAIPGKWGSLTTAADKTHGIGSRAFTGDTDAVTNRDTIANVSDFTGLVVGQTLVNANIPTGTTITALDSGAGTITMSDDATGTATGTSITAEDRIELNGENHPITLPRTLLDDLDSALDLMYFELETPHVAFGISNDVHRMRIYMLNPYYGDLTLRATNGQNYDPPLPEIGETVLTIEPDARTNRLRISEKGQPEAVPVGAGNELFVGDGELHRAVHMTDAEYVFATDGLWRVSGVFPDWIVDSVDSTLVLAARDAVARLGEDLYAYTNRGLVRVRPGGLVEEISRGLIGDAATLPGQAFADTWNVVVHADELNQEVHVMLLDGSTNYVFSARTNAWVTTDYEEDQGNELYPVLVYVESLQRLLWCDGGSTGAPQMRQRSTATKNAATGATAVFQPITGDGDEFTLKEWIDCSIDVFQWDTELVWYPQFSEIDQDDYPVTIPAGSLGGQRTKPAIVAGIARDAMLAETIAPRILIEEAGQDYTVSRWRLFGMSLRWMPAGEETVRR